MKNIIEASKEIMRRFIDAAHKKQENIGDWQKSHADNYFTDEQIAEFEEQEDKIQDQIAELEDNFTASLTKEQKRLKKRMEEIEDEMDLFSEEVYEKAKAEFEASELTTDQIDTLRKIDRLREQSRLLDDKLLPYVHKHLLTCEMPADMESEYAIAVSHVINAAIKLARFNQEEMPPGEQWINIIAKPDDRKFLLHTGEIDENIDLENIRKMLEQRLPDLLKNPQNWQKTTVKQEETGYTVKGLMIERPTLDTGIVFDIVNLLSQLPEFAGQAAHSHIVDGTVMSNNEYSAMERREMAETKCTDQPSPEHDLKRRIILTGKATDDILGALGVNEKYQISEYQPDQANSKPHPRRARPS